MKPPATVKVGARVYTVTVDRAAIDAASVREQLDLAGHVDHATHAITLAPDLSEGHTREALLHELLHVIVDATGMGDGRGPLTPASREEQVVQALGAGLLAVLRDNPRLLTYLTG